MSEANLAELRDVEHRLEDVASGLADGTLTVSVPGAATQKLEQRRKALTEQLARTLPEPEFDPTVNVSVEFDADGKPYIASATPALGPVLMDATIVRTILVPASMRPLGDWNWYLPRWLEWLPKLRIEGGEVAGPRQAPARPFEEEVRRREPVRR